MTTSRIHVVHVGNMNNKGTQALFKSDIQIMRDLVNDVSITVSTTDIEGVRKLDLHIKHVLPPMVDIPYERADVFAKKLMVERGSWRYKGFTVAMLVYMFLQIPLTILSVVLAKIGVKAPYRNDVVTCFKNSDLIISHSDESLNILVD